MSERNDKPGAGGRGQGPERRGTGKRAAAGTGSGKRGPGGPSSGKRAASGSGSGKRGAAGGSTDEAGRPRSGKRGSGTPRRSERRDTSARRDEGTSGGRRRDQGAGKPESRRSSPRREAPRRDDRDRTEAQMRYDGPPLPEDITGAELHRSVRAQLRSLPERLGLRVARHLVAAARLMDTDPETAYQHTLAARARAARIAMVREACGEAAYAAGHFKDALAEFKAARRMNGAPEYLPMMADCERALGRPDRALAIARDPATAQLDDAGRAEMTIVEAGARRDLGDVAASLRVLDGPQLRSRSRAPWAARLRYAYADALLAAGRRDDARVWFERAAGVDAEGATDAAERLAELDGAGDVASDLEQRDL